jgi:hypothetical protein
MMADDYAGLAALSLLDHGDARERDMWRDVSGSLSNYQTFWRELIVLLTNRVVPGGGAGPEWVRLRPSIPVEYEQMAMHNYSLFYYAAMARRTIDDDRKRLASGEYPHPERIFATMQTCVEQAKPLQTLARNILLRVGMDCPKLPKHPQDLYETIGAYRNAFAHDPVMGRAVNQSRELLPPKDRLPKHGRLLLWRDAAVIPAAEMIDGLTLADDLWGELAVFLQAQWKDLAEAFIEARTQEKFVKDLGLDGLLPVRCALKPSSPASPSAAATTVTARSDTH